MRTPHISLGLAFTALGLAALTGCGGPDLGASSGRSAFDSGLSGNYSGYGGSNFGGPGGNSRAGQLAGVSGRGTYPMLEASFELGDVKGNPFDYAENDVIVTIARPDNQTVKIPAFFDGGPNNKTWRVRYTPEQTGRVVIQKVQLNGHDAQPDKLEKREFDITGSAQPGFVRHDTRDKTRFDFDNGSSYYPLGHNVAWLDSPEAYEQTFDKMGKAGENWSRVWMTHWDNMNLDWSEKKKVQPGSIDLDVAKRWDRVVEAAEKNGIYFQMVLQHHGQYSTQVNPNWAENPWNKANGGFLSTPDEFFSSPRAVAVTKAKYRYILARYGYSPSIMAWELFNEVQYTDAVAHKHEDEVAAWHNEMADFLHKQDPYRHLVTSSAAVAAPMFGKNLDYWQQHSYTPDALSAVTAIAASKLDRPFFFGEVGPKPAAKDESAWLHRALWSSLMSESAGAAQWWAWETVEKNDLYGEFKAASEFAKQSGLVSKHGLSAASATIETTSRAPLTLAPGTEWGAARQTEFTVLPSGTVEGMGSMPSFLQGSAHREMFPSATFKTTYPAAGTFSVTVGMVSGHGGKLQILVDGNVAAEKAFEGQQKDRLVDAVIEAKVPAGAHSVRLENPGEDWISIRGISLSDYAPTIGAIGKAGKDFAAYWLTSRKDGGEPQKGKLTVPGLQSGSYTVTWFDTAAGRPGESETVTAANGAVTVNIPDVKRDIAVVVARSTGAKTASRPAKAEKSRKAKGT